VFIERIFWSLRKLTPIKVKGLVLYIGLDENIHPRADIIFEPSNKFTEKNTAFQKKLVCGNLSRLPFKDNVFDYVILSNIIDFYDRPDELLHELARISRKGYIESANAILERIYPHPKRKYEILSAKNKLILNRKKNPINDEFLFSANIVKDDCNWRKVYKNYPKLFHIRFFWEDCVDFKILNFNSNHNYSEDALNLDLKRKINKSNSFTLKGLVYLFFEIFYFFGRKKRFQEYGTEVINLPNS